MLSWDPCGESQLRNSSRITSGTPKMQYRMRRSSMVSGTRHRSGYVFKAASTRCKSVDVVWSSTSTRKKANYKNLKKDSNSPSARSLTSSRSSLRCNLRTYYAQARRTLLKKWFHLLSLLKVASVSSPTCNNRMWLKIQTPIHLHNPNNNNRVNSREVDLNVWLLPTRWVIRRSRLGETIPRRRRALVSRDLQALVESKT